ncbi:MAG: hypothetical protein EOP56_02315 [Sphingobacteriales bacterium]|nr:MAG: hypothetical protein EOP56_02315 [Sphingobacteriales bacterium]
MSGVLRFLVYLYLKALLLIGYDFVAHGSNMFRDEAYIASPQTQRAIYFGVMLFVIPILDTIIMALPVYLSMRYKGAMRYIMLAITFIIEFVVYYLTASNKVIEDRLIVKSIFSVIVFLLVYRKQLFPKPTHLS